MIPVNDGDDAVGDDDAMWPYHPDLLAMPVPRYTSYPTAAEFTHSVEAQAQSDGIAAIRPGQSVSLYIHIPYCREICWYCGCNTGAANRQKRLDGYLEALEAEIALVGRLLGGRGTIGRIAFGGGSPNAIAAIDFVRLLQQITLCLPVHRPEIAIELDPRTLTDGWIEALGSAGVKRASLGVQTFSAAVQKAMGRIQSAERIEASVMGLRATGIQSVNFDLMYGLPEQGAADIEDSLRRSIALHPDRIAFFGYAHVPHLLPRQRQIKGRRAGIEERFAMAALGFQILTRAGYVPIGFDHFALPHDPLAQAQNSGHIRRNFQGFTDDPAEILLGIGASAISSFPDRIVQNEKNPGRYRMRLLAGGLPGALGTMKGREDQVRGQIISDLLCRGTAAAGRLLCHDSLRTALQSFQRRDLIHIEGEQLVLTDAGRPYARAVAAIFDTYRHPMANRFSHAV